MLFFYNYKPFLFILQEGKLRDSCMIGSSDEPLENKIVSVCWATEMVSINWINFVAASREVAQEWTRELLSYATNLLALNSSVTSSLEKAHTKLSLITNTEGKIPVKKSVYIFSGHDSW